MLLKIGDLVVSRTFIGVFRIEDLSDDGVTADIQIYDFNVQDTVGRHVSVPVTLLTPFR
jgi:hypothetical protein